MRVWTGMSGLIFRSLAGTRIDGRRMACLVEIALKSGVIIAIFSLCRAAVVIFIGPPETHKHAHTMNITALSIAVRYGLILGIVKVISGVVILSSNFGTYAPGNMHLVSLFLVGVMWIAKVGILARSHYEFNEKNNGFISFKDAILIGLVILGITQVFSIALAYVNYEFVTRDQVQALMDKYPEADLSAWRIVFAATMSSILIDIVVLFTLIMMESLWKIFKKAGRDGWAALIPVYNTLTIIDIVGKPAIWFIFMFIPFVNIIFVVWVVNLLAKRFGKSEGYTIGLLFLPFIFYPMLGLSEQQMLPAEDVY
jgi:hypothetical protein